MSLLITPQVYKVNTNFTYLTELKKKKRSIPIFSLHLLVIYLPFFSLEEKQWIIILKKS